MKPIIRVEGLGKQYRIGRRAAPYATLRESLMGAAHAPLDRLRRIFDRHGANVSTREDMFWALRDVDFEVHPGEVVGVIGRNGAGKSTLLKILSRVTEPTEGCVKLWGRVASLLEVGTGFHPELTGRENIYLNGSILGMSRVEIARKFGEIVAFAEIDRFIDTPVKRYSSGMQMRLAFAVAAHLEPEVLIIDEVLAVGDVAFQKKCMAKMGDVAEGGRTILFVSHNLAAVRGLCSSGILLERGRISYHGTVHQAIEGYLNHGGDDNQSCKDAWHYRHRGQDVRIVQAEVLVDGGPSACVQAGLPTTFRVHYETTESEANGEYELSVSLMIYFESRKVVNLWTNYHTDLTMRIGRRGFVECTIPNWPFRSGQVRVDVYAYNRCEVQDWIEHLLDLDSHDGDYYKSGVVPNQDQGIMFLDHQWSYHAAQ